MKDINLGLNGQEEGEALDTINREILNKQLSDFDIDHLVDKLIMDDGAYDEEVDNELSFGEDYK